MRPFYSRHTPHGSPSSSDTHLYFNKIPLALSKQGYDSDIDRAHTQNNEKYITLLFQCFRAEYFRKPAIHQWINLNTLNIHRSLHKVGGYEYTLA